MSSPHTAATFAELTRAQNVHNEVVSGAHASMNRIDSQIMGELMPQFRGDAATSLAQLHARVQENTQRFNQATQQMADHIGVTGNQHMANDADGGQSFSRLASFLNGGGATSVGGGHSIA